MTDAQRIYLRIQATDANHADSLHLLGLIACQGGRIAEAVSHFERVLAIRPDSADSHDYLGSALLAQGKSDDAMAHYERALGINPNHADAHSNLANVLKDRGRVAEALVHYARALTLDPRRAEVHYNLASALMALGRVDDALAHYRRALQLKPEYADAHNNLGSALLARGELDAAREHSLRAVTLNPGHAEAHNNLGNIFAVEGKFTEARTHYGRAIAIRPDYAETHYNRAELKTFSHGDADLAALETLAARTDLSSNQALHIHFALAKALEDCGDYPRVFVHLNKANALKRRQIAYGELAEVKRFHRIATVFDHGLFERSQGGGDPSPVPIFVLGMPRSGSTLIEQILASHPLIHGAGELPALENVTRSLPYPECVPSLAADQLARLGQSYLACLPPLARGQARIIDKYPSNFLGIGLIRLILPNAKIIHTIRDPVDTCVSCYSKLFTSGVNYSYDLAELGRYYYCYSALMNHWRCVLPPGSMLDVRYENVVGDLEGQARRMIEYCGLPWDDRCLMFHASSRPVKTASAAQVRKPLYRSSLQRWRRYEGDLGPLLAELGDILR